MYIFAHVHAKLNQVFYGEWLIITVNRTNHLTKLVSDLSQEFDECSGEYPSAIDFIIYLVYVYVHIFEKYTYINHLYVLRKV